MHVIVPRDHGLFFPPSIYAQGECFLMRRNCKLCPGALSLSPNAALHQG
jgi:hypothetical protein